MLCESKISEVNFDKGREQIFCQSCSSTWRDQAMMAATAVGNGYSVKTQFEQPTDLSKRVVGIGDSFNLSKYLNGKFSYTNTDLYNYPLLDLTNVQEDLHGKFDIVTCSEVLEHIVPPVNKAIDNIYCLLKPGGFAVISVPLVKVSDSGTYYFSGSKSEINSSHTLEYYDGGTNFEIQNGVLTYQKDGKLLQDISPEFHGGDGLTVAFRLWSLDDLKESLKSAGFTNVIEPKEISDSKLFSKVDAGMLIARK